MVELIIDTDIGNDCDDAGAIAYACQAVNKKKVKLLGVTINTSDKYAPSCVDAIFNYYGVQAEVGVHKGNFQYSPMSFCKELAKKFGTISDKEREEAVRFLRRKLASSKDKSVTLCFIGQLNNFSDLLKSEKDDLGASGLTLVKNKVKEVVIMGGMFGKKEVVFENETFNAEYNIRLSVSDSKYAIANCPVDMVFADFNLGVDVLTLGELCKQADTNPVGFAYKVFTNKERPSWDILAVMYAIEGENCCFARSRKGKVSVGDNGETLIDYDDASLHSILVPIISKRNIEKYINERFGIGEK